MCALDAAGTHARLDEWASLRKLCRGAQTTARGATLWFDAAAEAALRTVATKEAACCGFLQLHVESHGAGVRLDISSEQREALPVIKMLASLVGGNLRSA